jgi:hypothetical protein
MTNRKKEKPLKKIKPIEPEIREIDHRPKTPPKK